VVTGNNRLPIEQRVKAAQEQLGDLLKTSSKKKQDQDKLQAV
jgi:hypothetical protein